MLGLLFAARSAAALLGDHTDDLIGDPPQLLDPDPFRRCRRALRKLPKGTCQAPNAHSQFLVSRLTGQVPYWSFTCPVERVINQRVRSSIVLGGYAGLSCSYLPIT